MMRRILFDKNLDFEINVIGYKEQGESIVFFLKADNCVIYAGLVDCYEEQLENVALFLLEKEQIERFDFVCWTHPHNDHTIGMDNIVENYCDENTQFWLPPIATIDVEEYTHSAQAIYGKLFQLLKSMKRKRMRINEASDCKILERFMCSGNCSLNPFIFEIRSFAPASNLLLQRKVKNSIEMGNLYSIGLIVNIGHFNIMLAGDVEDRTFKFIPDINLSIAEQIDYVKIPHHASRSASYLIDRFKSMNVAAPPVATTTVYRIHNLPDKEILKRYAMWGRKTKIYSTGNVDNSNEDRYNSGIIKTSFDVLSKKEIPIETSICGNAVWVNENA